VSSRHIRFRLTLAVHIPVYEIRFRPGFEHLCVVLDSIEDLMR
jgi:hypothetical protein